MIRTFPFAIVLIAAACSTPKETVSAINYLQEPIDAVCARNALIDAEGFSAVAAIGKAGGAEQFSATFNDDLPLTVIVRRQQNNTGEVSVFSHLGKETTPLQRREVEFAVRTADEIIYRQCTADGQINPGDGNIVLDPQE